MMSTSTLGQVSLLGLFELDPSGNVLYSRIEPDGDSVGILPDIAGRHFFEEVALFKNADEFRRRITRFTDGEGQADNFNFTCQLENGPVHVKVLLARICERNDGKRTKSILLHIRKV